jgi:hypothetical protein
MAEPERNIKIVQLSITRLQDWKMVKKPEAHVITIGTLFHNFTGHHHTRVLVLVTKIK